MTGGPGSRRTAPATGRGGRLIDRPVEVEEVVRLDGGAEWGWTTRAWDVAADGTVYWVDAESRHVMARQPNGDTGRVTDMPLTLFEDSEGRGVATALQVGPDGRLYLTAPSFESPDLETGQTMVGIIDPAEGLVSLRHNDPTLLYGMVFAGGYGWQQHEQGRWQPIVEMGEQQVLDGGTQRGLEHTSRLAPDGLTLEPPQPRRLPPRAAGPCTTGTVRSPASPCPGRARQRLRPS